MTGEIDSVRASKVHRVRVIEERRLHRSITVAVIVVIVATGNIADLLGWVPWGPGLITNKDRIWVLLSAGAFWLVVSMFVLCVHDLASVWTHGSQPPSRADLMQAKREAGMKEDPDAGPLEQLWDAAGDWAERYVGLVGLVGLIIGALLGHMLWRVGGY